MKVLVSALVVWSCGKSDKPTPAPRPEPSSRTMKRLIEQPLSPVHISVGAIPFTVSLPQAWLAPPATSDRGVQWDFGEPQLPTVAIEVMDALPSNWVGRTVGSAELLPERDQALSRVLLRADKGADGVTSWLEQQRDRRNFTIKLCQPIPQGVACCTVTSTSSAAGPIDDLETAELWGEKLCRTLTLDK